MIKRILHLASILFFLMGIVLLSRILEPSIFEWATNRIGRPPTDRTFAILKWAGWGGIFTTIAIQFYLLFVYPRHTYLSNVKKQFNEKFHSYLEKTLEKFVDFHAHLNTISITAFNYQDAIIFAAIFLFSLLWYIQRIQYDYPNVVFGSDLAIITSFAAALDHPDFFTSDFLLSDLANLKIYLQLHVLLARVLGSWFDNYSSGILSILFPTTLLYLIGLYWLGRTITHNRYWALLFTITNLFPMYLAFDTWGVSKDPTPRTGIQALLPFLLILIWKWKDTPNLKRWSLIAFFTGILIYIHAVSTPVWTVCILIGLWTQMPEEWGQKKRLMIFIGLCALTFSTQLAFILNYITHRVSGDVQNYREAIELLHFLLPPEIFDIPLTLQKTFRTLWNASLIPFGLLGIAILSILKRKNRKDLTLVFTWLIFVILISAILPLIERTVEAYLRILPLETDLIRGLRYLIPLLSLFSFWGMSELSARLKHTYPKWILAIIGIFIVVSVFNHRFGREFDFKATADCINTGKILCLHKSDLSDVLDTLRYQTEPNAAVFFANNPADTTALTVRYIAQRPLVYSWKDRGAGVSNLKLMNEWLAMYDQLEEAGETYQWFQRDPNGLVSFVQGLGAKYIVLNGQVSASDIDLLPAEIFHENETYTILILDE